LANADLSALGGRTVNVTLGPGIGYFPMSVTVHPGDTVLWTWSGSLPHTVTSGTPGAADGKFCSLSPGSTPSVAACSSASYARMAPFTFSEINTFRTPGTYP